MLQAIIICRAQRQAIEVYASAAFKGFVVDLASVRNPNLPEARAVPEGPFPDGRAHAEDIRHCHGRAREGLIPDPGQAGGKDESTTEDIWLL